jgi:hypothetical protein
VKRLEAGEIDRREFCQMLALCRDRLCGRQERRRPGFERLQSAGHQSLLLHLPGLLQAGPLLHLGLEVAKDTLDRANLMFGPDPGNGGTLAARVDPGGVIQEMVMYVASGLTPM